MKVSFIVTLFLCTTGCISILFTTGSRILLRKNIPGTMLEPNLSLFLTSKSSRTTTGSSSSHIVKPFMVSPSSSSVYTSITDTMRKITPTVSPVPETAKDDTDSGLNTSTPVTAVFPPTTGACESKETVTTTLPWAESVKSSRSLTYMPMLIRQLQLLSSLGLDEVEIAEDFREYKSTIKPARIGNICFRSEHFRKIRMTYFDAGDAVQVYNTLWYPSYEYDLPLLGVDLISLGSNRVLTVIDFQPLYPDKRYHDQYIAQLTSVRDKYPDLHGKLSGKIYDDTSFFSKNMLFGRFSDESKIKSVVEPAFKDYLDEYIKLMKNATPNSNVSAQDKVRQRQKAYDIYSAEKDPAVGLFDAYFGKQWSRKFVADYLFSLTKLETSEKQSQEKTSPSQTAENKHVFDLNGSNDIPTIVKSS